LPDFRNLGVILRVLLAVNLLAALTVLVRADAAAQVGAELLLMAARVELPLFCALLALFALAPWIACQRLPRAAALVVALAVFVMLVLWPLLSGEGDNLGRWLMWTLSAAAMTLLYFDYRTCRYSPALTEARLLALTARIRPHFLFNSLNAVLGVIRSDPRRAERALEELADLFRVFMRDNRDLVPLADEIALCERYVSVEQLRLGDKLCVRWEIGEFPPEMPRAAILVPPLLLQPLLENAIYHGIEASAEGGEIVVRLAARRDKLTLEVDNPLVEASAHRNGNKMALDNIRERLMLYYDLEAELVSAHRGGRYCVRVSLPVKQEAAR
jgi:two-component system sensor histidine kinase AlgZ